MITGIGVMTGVYRDGAWSDPGVDGDQVTRVGRSRRRAASVDESDLHVQRRRQDHAHRAGEQGRHAVRRPTDTIPAFVKAIVNAALANNTPLIVAYTGDDGAPVLSLRGSVQAYSDTQLSIWVRHANGGMANTLRKNPAMALDVPRSAGPRHADLRGARPLRRRSERSATASSSLMPEVEQRHDLDRTGAALIIDVDRVTGSTPRGGVRMARQS